MLLAVILGTLSTAAVGTAIMIYLRGAQLMRQRHHRALEEAQLLEQHAKSDWRSDPERIAGRILYATDGENFKQEWLDALETEPLETFLERSDLDPRIIYELCERTMADEDAHAIAHQVKLIAESLHDQGRRTMWQGWMFFGLGVVASVGVSLVFWLLGTPG